MKKLLASAVCLGMILSSAVLFTGCGEKIYIDGDFSKEATAEEVNAVLASVQANEDTLFGDTTEEGWDYGMRFIEDTAMKVSLSEAGESMSMDISAGGELNAVYDADGIRASGSLNSAFNMSSTAEDATSVEANVEGNVYLTGSALYLDGAVKVAAGEQSVDVNGKYSLGALNDYVMVELPDAEGIGADMLSALKATGAKIYIDAGDAETKVKVSYDLEGFLDAGMLPDVGGDLAAFMDAVEFDNYDIYFSFLNDTGELTGYGYVAGMRIPETTVGEGENAATLSMDVSANVWYLAGDAQVQEPEDIGSYENIMTAIIKG